MSETAIETRFKFGKNWSNFLKLLNETRITEAKKSIQNCLGLSDLKGKTFLDIGSGSGLFSLAAHQLGAQVTSFDYDVESVACTNFLKEKYGNAENSWQVFQGSVLDQTLIQKLGLFDVVYSWGVLHHTGNLLQALTNAHALVRAHGFLFISIYNDQGGASKRWTWVKKHYNQGGLVTRYCLMLYTLFRQWTLTFIRDLLKTGNFLKTWNNYSENRGMSAYYDLIDWVGGYPFEAAKPEVIFDFFRNKGFELICLKTCGGGVGCNEFVFKKRSN
jgi:2-polyprenyl-3-methyl-5-hydroxy-6-metoxy-1,4-benzoquinol methylase